MSNIIKDKYTLAYRQIKKNVESLNPIMSFKKIEDQFPPLTDIIKNMWTCENWNDDEESPSNLQKKFGNCFNRLNKNLLNQINIPGKYYVLCGQNYWGEENRNQCISEMTFLGYDKDTEEITVYESFDIYQLYLSSDEYGEKFGSGSGCDPVYIFMDK